MSDRDPPISQKGGEGQPAVCDLSEDHQLRRALGGRQRRDAVAQRTLRALPGNILPTFCLQMHLGTGRGKQF